MTTPPIKWIVRPLVGVALVACLLWQSVRSDALERLRSAPLEGAALSAAMGLVLVSITLTFLRWRLTARAAGISLGWGEAMRWGALGYASNFVAPGNVGGDLVKAALAAKNRPGVRGLAASTVLVDRLIGLLGLLLCAAAAVLVTGSASEASGLPRAAIALSRTTLAAAGAGLAFYLLVIAPGQPLRRLCASIGGAAWGRSWRWVGRVALGLAGGIEPYHHGSRWLIASLGLGLVCDALFILSFYAVAVGLPLAAPGLADHFLLVPLAMIAGAVPISPSGLGTIEAASEVLYRALGVAEGVAPGDGTLVALAHRLAMMTAGGLAVVYYLFSRSESRADAPATDSSTGHND